MWQSIPILRLSTQYECVSFDINDILLNIKTNSIQSRLLCIPRALCTVTTHSVEHLQTSAFLVKLICHSISNLKQIIITHYQCSISQNGLADSRMALPSAANVFLSQQRKLTWCHYNGLIHHCVIIISVLSCRILLDVTLLLDVKRLVCKSIATYIDVQRETLRWLNRFNTLRKLYNVHLSTNNSFLLFYFVGNSRALGQISFYPDRTKGLYFLRRIKIVTIVEPDSTVRPYF